MRYKGICSSVFLMVVLFLLPVGSFGQGGIDAVSISSKYYNSIVKILLYDSASRMNPDKAYLGRGSGFFVSSDGYIFTNRHVISMTYNGFCRYKTYDEDSKKFEDNIDVYNSSFLKDPNISKITAVGRATIIVQLFTNSRGDSSKLYHAQIVALDTANFDGAIIKIVSDMDGHPVTEKFHPLPIGNSDSIKQGQDLCLFGFPAQYGGNMDVMLKDLSTLILGKHSGYDYTYNAQFGFIKTDAVINAGNSGGPVFGPNNKVIGIATAAFEKTNIGLIGGIDAMYYVAAVVPDLKKLVTDGGLTAPSRPPGFSAASLYKPVPLPTAKMIKRANNSPGKKGNSGKKAYVIFDLAYGAMLNTNYSIASSSPTDPNFTTNGGGSYKVPSQEYGFGFRLVKPAFSFFKQPNNLIGYFVDLSPSVLIPNWQSAQIISPATTNTITTITMKNGQGSNNTEIDASLTLGLSYMYLFRKNVSISVYYGAGINATQPNYLVPIATAEANGVTQNIGYTRQGPSLIQTTGIIFRFKPIFIGADFRLLNTNVQYSLPDVTGNNMGNTVKVSGTSTRSVISAVLGFKL